MNLIKNILWNSCITIIKLPRTKTYFNETLIDIYMPINFTKKQFLEFIYLTLCDSKFVWTALKNVVPQAKVIRTLVNTRKRNLASTS